MTIQEAPKVIYLGPGRDIVKPVGLAPEVVDPFLGKMSAKPKDVPCVDESTDDGCSHLLGVVEGTKSLELGA